jgi:hypothetical protein
MLLIVARVWEIELTEVTKFGAILVIIAVGVAYARVKSVNRLLKPVFGAIARKVNDKSDMFVEGPFALLKKSSTAFMHTSRGGG